MSNNREPYWLSKKELKQIETCLLNDPKQSKTHEGILQEISVAVTRRSTHKSINALTTALGLSKGAIPLYLNNEELTYIQNLEHLNSQLKRKLTA